ncbi:unnamed protein product [Lampetra planeri]
MSKHLKIKNSPAPSSDDDDDSLNQDLPTPGAADPVTATAVASAKAPGKDVGAEPSSPLARDYGWRRVAEQINSLCTVLLNLVTLVASSVAPGRPQDTLPSRDEQGFLWRSRKGRVAEPRGARLTEAASPKDNGAGRSHRLPNIKEFVAGGDWGAFTCRFKSAFRSVRWTEEEALDALPTLLDDVSLAVFRSIPSEKKKTLKDAFAEMA